MDSQDKKYIELALEQARKSVEAGEFAAGAVIVKDGKVISEAICTGHTESDPTGHAETVAIRKACRNLNTLDLSGTTMYESVECCLMCFSAAVWAGISKIVYAARKTPEMVEKGYYEGASNIQTINRENRRQIELVFAEEFEQKSLEIIENWEKKGGFNK